MKLKVSRGTISVGYNMMASGSGGGTPGGPPKPKLITKPPKRNWLQRLIAWVKDKLGL